MPKPTPQARGAIEIEYDARTYTATYRHIYKDDWVYVESPWGNKNARAGASGPILIGQILLREILDAAKGRGKLSH